MMWGFAKRSARALEVTPKHEELFRDADDPAEATAPETSQNSADAISPNANRVRMRFGQATLGMADFESRWVCGLRKHMDAWKPGLCDEVFAEAYVECLVVEDFGTRGLEGELDKPGSAFYAFWRQYGASPKGGDTGGRHGVGKSTLAAASRARLFFGLTVRESDERKLLMGQAILGPHELGGEKYEAYGEFSPTVGDTLPEPFEGARADEFAADFALARTDEPGLSIVVPIVQSGILDDDMRAVKRALIANCFPQIAARALEFEVSGEILNRETLVDWVGRFPELNLAGAVDVVLAAHDDPPIWEPTKKDGDLGVDSFDPDEFRTMRDAFAVGKLVSVRVPVEIKPKMGGTTLGGMRLHLKKTFGKMPKAEIYARSRLTVPKQRKVLAGHETIGFLLAEDGPLSDFLGDAEPPSHARWTHQNLRDTGKYRNPQPTLSKVANALRHLERVLQDEDAETVNENAFRSLFARPRAPEPKKPKEPGEKPPPLPPARPFWQVNPRAGGFELVRPDDEVPADVDVAVAYAKRRGSPDWRSSDFKLVGGAVTVGKEGAADVDIDGNVVRISAAEAGFKLTADGFDPNRDVVVVVKAGEEEEEDGAKPA